MTRSAREISAVRVTSARYCWSRSWRRVFISSAVTYFGDSFFVICAPGYSVSRNRCAIPCWMASGLNCWMRSGITCLPRHAEAHRHGHERDQEERSAVGEKRERNTGDWHQADGHAHVLYHVREPQARDPEDQHRRERVRGLARDPHQ